MAKRVEVLLNIHGVKGGGGRTRARSVGSILDTLDDQNKLIAQVDTRAETSLGVGEVVQVVEIFVETAGRIFSYFGDGRC